MNKDHHHNFEILGERKETGNLIGQSYHPCCGEKVSSKLIKCKDCEKIWEAFYCELNTDRLTWCYLHYWDKKYHQEIIDSMDKLNK